jgi:hypothetical protein
MDNGFRLQARTGRAVKEDGNFSDATIFTAFAASDSSGAKFHVELNDAENGKICIETSLIIYSFKNIVYTLRHYTFNKDTKSIIC